MGDPGSQSERAIWKSSEPDKFNESFPVLESWLNKCKKEHSCPTFEPQPLLRRLLCISNSGPRVKLRLMEQESNKRGLYAALSYCSGLSSDFCTTRGNYHEYLQSISAWQLPKTISDAVEVARRLGFSYLWVDRLCII
ncbi:hypothetical protein F9C07_2932 [Aspergillus flavus]|uniref:Heterokaryon incompatibility domain-containing protein n=1 Tax=Aspergillus flavus (strain ATCC 200026 / FGSC A1120 / IAM 13836 / NRRL 3357 / JCM 12722 / SRRC 167) TaxID=332952 RepID=A0A7U2QTD9_ASPFN|nr:hypothetical protein F9C07_2932 [Aspergillus flavus]